MNLQSKLEVANEYMLSKKYSKASIEFKNILIKWPNNIWALNGLIKALICDKNYNELIFYIMRRTSLPIAEHASDNDFIASINILLNDLRLSGYDNVMHYRLCRACELEVIEWCRRVGISVEKVDAIEFRKSIDYSVINSTKQEPRIAVLIAGQFRGYSESINSIKKFLGSVNYDVYVAAWDSFGFRDITSDKRSYKHLGRTFDEGFCNLVTTYDFDLTGYLDSARNLKARLTRPFEKEVVSGVFSKAKINVLDEKQFEDKFTFLETKLSLYHPESEVVFASPINMLKMVYANHDALQQAISSNVNYTHILKVRPDFIFSELESLKGMLSRSKHNPDVSILDSWGNGIGDQFFFGKWESGLFYNNLWSFWLNMDEPIKDIGNLFKPHKRLKDYLKYGHQQFLLHPKLRKGLDESGRIDRNEHLELVLSDFDYFKNNATKEQLRLFGLYSKGYKR